MAVSDFPLLDFSIISKYPALYEAGQERSRANAFASGIAGLPRNAAGEIDMNAAIQLAARTGNIRSLADLIKTQGIYSEQEANRQAAALPSLFSGMGGQQPQQPQQPTTAPPAQNMIPGNLWPIMPAPPDQRFRTGQAEADPDVPVGTERPMELPRTAAGSGASSASGLPYDYGNATFVSEPKTRLAYGTDGATATDLPPIFTKPPMQLAQVGGGTSDLSGGFNPGARPVRTVPIAPTTTGQRQPQQPVIPSLTDASRVPALMAALRSRRLPEGQRAAAMLYLKNVFEADNPTAEMRNIDFIRRNPELKELYLELKRAGSPQTNLTTVEGFENARLKSRLALDQKQAEGLQAQVQSGQRVLPLIDHVMQLADRTPGGWAGSISPAVARGLSALGIPVPEGMSNAEAFATISRQFIPAVREPGPTSQQEQVWYFEAVPGLMQSPEGRKKIADITRRMINHSNNLYGIMRENLGDPELHNKLRAASEKPLFSQAEYDEMDRLIAQGGAKSPEHRPISAREYINLPRPQSKAEYDQLPVGTKYVTPDGRTTTKKAPRSPDL